MAKFIIFQSSVIFNLFSTESYEDSIEGRNKAFKDTLALLKNKRLITTSLRTNGEYKLKYIQDVEEIYVFLLLKKQKESIYDITNYETIIKNEYDNYPHILVLFDGDTQRILIEQNDNFSYKNAIQKIFNNICSDKAYDIRINTITDAKKFWSVVKDNYKLKNIEFDLFPPNFLGGNHELKNSLKKCRENLNCDSVKICFKNKKGNLYAKAEYLDELVKYSSKAGNWKLKLVKSGKVKTIKSSDQSKSKDMDEIILSFFKNHLNGFSKEDFTSYVNDIKQLFGDEND